MSYRPTRIPIGVRMRNESLREAIVSFVQRTYPNEIDPYPWNGTYLEHPPSVIVLNSDFVGQLPTWMEEYPQTVFIVFSSVECHVPNDPRVHVIANTGQESIDALTQLCYRCGQHVRQNVSVAA